MHFSKTKLARRIRNGLVLSMRVNPKFFFWKLILLNFGKVVFEIYSKIKTALEIIQSLTPSVKKYPIGLTFIPATREKMFCNGSISEKPTWTALYNTQNK